MRRLQPFPQLLHFTAICALAVSAGCSEGTDGFDPNQAEGPDAGPRLPDARVLPGRDAGELTLPVPTVTRVTPSSGPTRGGTRVTIRGTAFIEPVEVFFGAEAAPTPTVLDEQTLAATAPPGALGPVTLRVVTGGGAAELPLAFTYTRELRLDSVSPARIPDEGGLAVVLRGTGFTPETVVLFDRQPLRGLQVVSEEEIRGLTPQLSVGRAEVRVVTNEGAVRRSDVAAVYGTPDILGMASGFGSSMGGAVQEISGNGLLDASAVLIGGAPATALEVGGNDRIRFNAPALAPGVHDVVVENADTRGVKRGAYLAYDPARIDFHVLGVTPARVPSGTRTVVTIVGGGFDSSTQVSTGIRRLLLSSLRPNALEVELPADLPVGAVTFEVTRGANQATAQVEVFSPVEVASVVPASGPASGGTQVTVSGSNFRMGAEVRIGGVALADVTVVDANTVTGVTVAGAHGRHDVVVRQSDERAALPGGFVYTEPFSVVRVEPVEGSVAGNTYVSIIGRGFDEPLSVLFGPEAGLQPVLENGAVVGVRSPPAAPGVVDVSITTGSGAQMVPDGFSYYDPRLLAGGAWGGPIEGSVNVAVVDGQGAPLSGMLVQLGTEADPRYRATTDLNGLATISSPEIRGAQTVTAGGESTEFVTFTDINARNITMVSAAHPEVAPPDAPLSPCPTGQPPPVVRGRVFGLKTSSDPETSPDTVPVVQITYTQSNVFSPNPPMPPEQTDVVGEEGEAYEIVVMRAGVVGVYAILYDFNQTTQELTPRRMGIARGVPVAPDTATEGIDISLDIEMDQTLRIRLDNPPDQNPGPGFNAVFPFLNLESDGVIAFDASLAQPGQEVILENMPALAESQFFYMGGSLTLGPEGGLGSPYSLTLLESGATAEDGVDLGPYLEMPTNVRPKPNELLEDGTITWDQGGPQPDLTTLSVVDIGAAGGACCVDLNENGQCDEGEPPMGGALPVQFNRWSLYGPGGLQSYELPRMPSGVQAFEPPRVYSYLLQMAIVPRFSWEEFAYNQFSPFFWQSWVVWSSAFTVKEETD